MWWWFEIRSLEWKCYPFKSVKTRCSKACPLPLFIHPGQTVWIAMNVYGVGLGRYCIIYLLYKTFASSSAAITTITIYRNHQQLSFPVRNSDIWDLSQKKKFPHKCLRLLCVLKFWYARRTTPFCGFSQEDFNPFVVLSTMVSGVAEKREALNIIVYICGRYTQGLLNVLKGYVNTRKKNVQIIICT